MTHAARKALFTSAALGAAVLWASFAWAAPPPPAGIAAPSREMREKMAEVHDKMAACLRSDKPIAVCHREMMQNCRAALGVRRCRMMQRRGMGMGMGMGPGRRMMSPPAPPAPPVPPPSDQSTPPP